MMRMPRELNTEEQQSLGFASDIEIPSSETTQLWFPQDLIEQEPKLVCLEILGKPKGKARPRVVTKDGVTRAFTPKDTVLAEGEIRRHWEAKGSPRFSDDSAISLSLTLFVERPAAHFTSRGLLSATGKRYPLPRNRKPDLDNALKLVMDALNGRAWKDDVQVAKVSIVRQWSHSARTLIWISPIDRIDPVV